MHMHDVSIPLLLALGAAHGVNPAMGWLFAVSLGLQEQRRGAVWGALGPLALGHALAIAVAVAAAGMLGWVVSVETLKVVAAVALCGFGVFHLTRHRHPRLAGMRVGPKDLTVWSFFMASAHGAGLMVVPLVLGGVGADAELARQAAETLDALDAASVAAGGHMGHGNSARGAVAGHAGHMLAAGLPAAESAGLMATLVHTAGYLLVAGVIAVVVYEKLGLRLLRTAWINLNVTWAGALILTAALTLLI